MMYLILIKSYPEAQFFNKKVIRNSHTVGDFVNLTVLGM